MLQDQESRHYARNPLAEALSLRLPAIWVHAADQVEVIERIRAHTRTVKDIFFYIFDVLEGLQKWNPITERFDTVLTQGLNMMTGEPDQDRITDLSQVLQVLRSDNHATLFIANAEQYETGLNDIFTYMSFSWRTSWSQNTSYRMPFQIILGSTTEPNPPEQLKNIVPTITFGIPTANELSDTARYIAANCPKYIQGTTDYAAVGEAAKGLGQFEAQQIFHSQLFRTGRLDIDALRQLTFSRLASRSNLDIIIPRFKLSQVAGADNLKKIIQSSIWIDKNPKEAAEHGHHGLHRFLLLGLPGTGKSMLAEAAADELTMNLVRTGLTQQMSHWHGGSENNVQAFFQHIEQLKPIVVWCDEFGRDMAGGQSSHVVDGGTTARTHGLFLTGLQDLSPENYFFAAGNDVSQLAPEMLRADRFDWIGFVGYPTARQRAAILTNEMRNLTHDVDIEKMAEASPGYTGAELATAVKNAKMLALENRSPMNDKDLKRGLVELRDRLWIQRNGYVLEEYAQARKKWRWACDEQKEESSAYAMGNLPTSKVSLSSDIDSSSTITAGKVT